MSVPAFTEVSKDVLDDVKPAAAGEVLAALLGGVAVASLTGLGWLRVTGEDRVRWLNGMLTNSIQTLKPGEGAYNFALSAQGRIQADATVFALADELRLETTRAAELATLLERFIIMDDVELTGLPAADGTGWQGLLVAGPEARRMLESISDSKFMNSLTASLMIATGFDIGTGESVDLIHAHSPLVERFELWGAAATIAALEQTLITAGATRADADALEDLRLLEGTPLYGVDIREKELPQETAQDRALHFSKGCYLGQEIVERIRSRGNVHRTFHGFQLAGDLPAAGTPLFASAAASDPAARPVGEITSARNIHLAGGTVQLALGYIRREALELSQAHSQPLTYAGGQASPVRLPFHAALPTSPAAE